MAGYREIILETLFPRRCVACGAFGAWCCDTCLTTLELAPTDPCVKCLSMDALHECEGSSDSLFDGLAVIGFYHDPVLRGLVHGLKYQSATELTEDIALVMAHIKRKRISPWPWAGETDMSVQAVIATPKRIRERGFDQAEIIADLAQQELFPWATRVSLLERKSSAQAQAELEPGLLRTANVKDAFTVGEGVDVPEVVILVDDVLTTGATMRAAARVLRKAGVKRIYGFAFAIGK